MWMFPWLFLVVFALSSGRTFPFSNENIPLNEWPMLMAHDAATTYLEDGLLHPIYNWAKTQPNGGFKKMLECGGRSFDLRVTKDKETGNLIGHHGKILVKHKFADMVDEIVHWSASNKNGRNDFVHVSINHSNDVLLEVKSLFEKRGIVYVTDCSSLKGLTISEALHLGKVSTGGSILVTSRCVESNYDPQVTCSGFFEAVSIGKRRLKIEEIDAFEYTCYNTSSTKEFPLNRLYKHIDDVIARGPPADGRLYQVQALWQETATTITIGTLHGSSLILDEKWSDLNNIIAQRIQNRQIDASRLGILEVNNICHNGIKILNALRSARGIV